MVSCKYIWIIMLVLLSASVDTLSAQMEVSPSLAPQRVADLWSLEIDNLTGANRSIYVNMILRKDNQVMYQARSGNVQSFPGVQSYQYSMFSPISEDINLLDQEEISGSYKIDIQVIDAQDRQQLGHHRGTIDNGTSDTLPSDDRESLWDKVNLGGKLYLYGKAASMQGVGSQVPQDYFRAELYPTLTVGAVPIGVDVLLSTEQSNLRQNINQVAFRFDVQQFRQNLERQFLQKVNNIEAIGTVTEIQSLQSFKQKVAEKHFPQLAKWEAQLKDPDIIKGLQELNQLENIDKILTNPEIEVQKAKLRELTKAGDTDHAEYDRLIAFVSEIDNLKNKANQLRALTDQYKQYKYLADKVSAARKTLDKHSLKDPAIIQQGLRDLQLMSKAQEWLSSVDALTIGTSYPYYSRQTLSSLSVNGLHFEFSPSNFYFSGTIGSSAKEIFNTSFSIPQLTFPQRTLALKTGYGDPYDTHLHVSYVNIVDQSSMHIADATQRGNSIFSIDGKLRLLQQIEVGGEVSSSLYTSNRNLSISGEGAGQNSELPFYFRNQANASSSYGVAWNAYANVHLRQTQTRVRMRASQTDSEYFSLGAPVLLNDLMRWKVDVQQSLISNRVMLSAYAKRDENQTDPLRQTVATITESFGLMASVNFPNAPSFTVNYAPYSQNSTFAATNEELQTDNRLLSINMSHQYRITNSLQASTQLGYINQELQSSVPGIDNSLTMYTANQSIRYKDYGLQLAFTYTPERLIHQVSESITTMDLSTNFTVFNKWSNRAGFQLLSISDHENKTGFYWQSLFPISNMVSAEFRLQRNVYERVLDRSQDFGEFYVNGGVRVRM